MAVPIQKRYFNVDEYHRMAEAGILSEHDRVELIEGEIVEMSPIGVRHNACIDRLNALLNRYATPDAIVRVQGSVRLSDLSEPQPDIALLRFREDFYGGGQPGPADILLIIEVADTSLPYDRGVKLPLYAGAGISEFWLVDLPGQAIEVYTRPSGGEYRASRVARRGESLAVSNIPGLVLTIDDILGEI